MNTKHLIIFFFLLLSSTLLYGQKQFKVVSKETGSWRQVYYLVDENEKIIRQLDTSKYFASFNNEQYGYFAIFGITGVKGWAAIDANENILFKVYNTSAGEPSPDDLTEDRIRIVDEKDLIGFANSKGAIIIKPQFEMVTAYHNGKAIIGQACKKIPWNNHAKESDCHHYSILCNQNGYINKNGTILKMGTHSFEQIRKEIDWKSPGE